MTMTQHGTNVSAKDLLLEEIRLAEERFAKRNPKSLVQYETACRWLPGGSTRMTVYYSPFPLTIEKGEDGSLWDVDGHRYLNFVGEYTVGVFGHDREMLQKILAEIERKGTMLSGPTEYEAKLAELICSRFPSCELIRFCNSGTEANLLATSLARKATGKEAVLVFKGGYHGGVLTFGVVDAPLNIPLQTVKADFNDVEGTRTLIRQNASTLAAILVEPMMGSGGCIPGTLEFLQMLRDEATKNDIVLIFDEVMTSRLSPGGLQGKFGIAPDLTTFGKYMGGGFSFGAFAGKRDLMSRLDARSPNFLSHAGTFNNNIASMIGGYISLSQYYTPDANIRLNALGDTFRENLNRIARQYDAPISVTGLGAVMNIHFGRKTVNRPEDAAHPDGLLLKRHLHLYMIEKGIYIASRALVTLNLKLTAGDVEIFLESFESYTKDNQEILKRVSG